LDRPSSHAYPVSDYVRRRIFRCALYILHAKGSISFKVPDGLAFILSILHPAIAASVVTYAMSGRKGLRELFGRLLIWRVSGWWYVFIFGFYAIVMLGGNLLHVAFGGTQPVIPVAGDPHKVRRVSPVWRCDQYRRTRLARCCPAYLKAKYNNALAAALLVSIPEVFLHVPDYFDPEMNFRRSAGIFAFTIFGRALSVIFAWAFINTKGSLVIVTLFHASGNAWSNLLTDDSARSFYFSVAPFVLFAIGITLINGPKNLSRHTNE
jgi:hypothetical protein